MKHLVRLVASVFLFPLVAGCGASDGSSDAADTNPTPLEQAEGPGLSTMDNETIEVSRCDFSDVHRCQNHEWGWDWRNNCCVWVGQACNWNNQHHCRNNEWGWDWRNNCCVWVGQTCNWNNQHHCRNNEWGWSWRNGCCVWTR